MVELKDMTGLSRNKILKRREQSLFHQEFLAFIYELLLYDECFMVPGGRVKKLNAAKQKLDEIQDRIERERAEIVEFRGKRVVR